MPGATSPELLGAAAALVVNNNAAALLLAVTALAAGSEIVVSRGELVEIGGGFRIPDVIRQGGARLREVGTTNRTRLADYREAITTETRVLLKVHQSNYRIEGFTAAVGVAELAQVARERGLVLIDDLGSGTLRDPAVLGRAHEPTVQAAVSAGADIVCFSGDKLLGGPQAGILVGAPRARRIMAALLREGVLVCAVDRVQNRSYVFHQSALQAARQALAPHLEPPGLLLREAAAMLGVSRKYAVPLLEYLDAIHFTRRVEDRRVLVRPP